MKAPLAVFSRRAPREAVAWLAFALALAAAPFMFSSGMGVALATQVCIAIVACLSWNMLYGQGGMLSFAHAVPMGLGGYAAIHLLDAAGQGGLRVPAAMLPLAGGVAAALASWLIGLVATRQGGMVFAMITLGLGELVHALATMSPWFGGEGGVSGNRSAAPALLGVDLGPPLHLYALVAGYAFVCAFAMRAHMRTPAGFALAAVRENATRAAFMGLAVRRVRLQAFVFAGFFAGVAGGLSALALEIVTPEALGASRSASVLLFTVLGGTRQFAGPIAGAVLMVCCSALLPALTQAWLLYVGLAFMGMMMFEPGGVSALLLRGRDALHAWLQGGLTRGKLRRLAVQALPLAGLIVAVAAAMLAIEMLYRLRLDTGAGLRLRLAGIVLDAGSPGAWCAVGAALLGSLLVWQWPRVRRLAMRRQARAASAQPSWHEQGRAP